MGSTGAAWWDEARRRVEDESSWTVCARVCAMRDTLGRVGDEVWEGGECPVQSRSHLAIGSASRATAHPLAATPVLIHLAASRGHVWSQEILPPLAFSSACRYGSPPLREGHAVDEAFPFLLAAGVRTHATSHRDCARRMWSRTGRSASPPPSRGPRAGAGPSRSGREGPRSPLDPSAR
jgi:hypothetical protein